MFSFLKPQTYEEDEGGGGDGGGDGVVIGELGEQVLRMLAEELLHLEVAQEKQVSDLSPRF